MKFTKILKVAALITLLVSLVMMALAIIYDYDYDVAKFISYLLSGGEAVEFLLTLGLSTFSCSVLLIWGFWRTALKRKAAAISISIVVAAGLYVYTYSDFLYFDYIAQSSPYDGYFRRDALKDNQSEAHSELRKDFPQLYQDTIGRTSLKLEKHRAWLYGNKSSLNSSYNVCIQDEQITFVATVDFFDDGDYCKPDAVDKVDSAKFTLKLIENNKYFCQDCENYLLPTYWEFIGKPKAQE